MSDIHWMERAGQLEDALMAMRRAKEDAEAQLAAVCAERDRYKKALSAIAIGGLKYMWHAENIAMNALKDVNNEK
jgi:hypothetical protein